MFFDREGVSVFIRVIQGCNLDCTHCFTLGDKDPVMQGSLEDVEVFLRLIRENVNPKSLYVFLHGGETFLADIEHLTSVARLAKSIFEGVDLQVIPQTNLIYKLTQDKIDFIKNECNSTVACSWDAEIRFKNIGQEDLFFRNMAKLLEEGIDVSISICAQRHLLKYDPYDLLPKFDGVQVIDFELLTVFDEKTAQIRISNQEWSDWYNRVVDYYLEHEVTWTIPALDLIVESIRVGSVGNCKCNCCEKRTFSINATGTVGLCPDQSYRHPLFNIKDGFTWEQVEDLASTIVVERIINSTSERLCYTCDHYDICGGNCEKTLFDDTDECPMSRKLLSRVRSNYSLFEETYRRRADDL